MTICSTPATDNSLWVPMEGRTRQSPTTMLTLGITETPGLSMWPSAYGWAGSLFTEQQRATLQSYVSTMMGDKKLNKFLRWASEHGLMPAQYRLVVAVYLLRARFLPEVRQRNRNRVLTSMSSVPITLPIVGAGGDTNRHPDHVVHRKQSVGGRRRTESQVGSFAMRCS